MTRVLSFINLKLSYILGYFIIIIILPNEFYLFKKTIW